MFSAFAVLQFPFVFVSQLMIGFVIYGSDFGKSTAGYIYIGMVVSLFVLGAIFKSRKQRIPTTAFNTLMVVGCASSAYLFSRLVMNYWDEHDSIQAALVLIAGLSSWLLAKHHQHVFSQSSNTQKALALLLISVIWFCAIHYPMVGFLALSLSFMAALIWPKKSHNEDESALTPQQRLSLYPLLVIAGIELSIGMWDQGIDTSSLQQLFWAFGIAGLFLYFTKPSKFPPVSIFIATFLAPVFLSLYDPQVIVTGGYAVIIGLLISAFLTQIFSLSNIKVGRLAAYWGLGFLLGHFFYSNLSYVGYRVVIELLIIASILLVGFVKRQKSSRMKWA